MLWVKAFHIVFVVSWFAGLFYLPRIFSPSPWCRPTVMPNGNGCG